ncbi:hypothetical protein FISHEDRAFT_34616 [Fistulina hepatica ATCC 64428]|uniref:Zinc finger CHCC-type domain-containing protein n=1 Tax=Fistulina hepatica ATCC 64428 TaxID=1128425 RepID=A0A0D7AMC1_9AGAR|nr:hypothetical protein FISHEDRAFT_34616 [Fistulina hepatica ATCC 64428]
MLGRRALSSAVCRNIARSSVRAASTSASASTPASPPTTASVPKEELAEPPQAPNYATKWTADQRPRPGLGASARFEQVNMAFQPAPLSAMAMIAEEPIRMVHSRKAVCDGGSGPLGHPKIYINLDQPGPKACG